MFHLKEIVFAKIRRHSAWLAYIDKVEEIGTCSKYYVIFHSANKTASYREKDNSDYKNYLENSMLENKILNLGFATAVTKLKNEFLNNKLQFSSQLSNEKYESNARK